ncbi:MerR family transcriptional regulator [Brachybacterium sp. NBEC-018]|uniref:MerR family transcriptional regulator n=1 Tax=Brachybacterium sp. NBEC-018 TaxID=2996004 RepID=UPI0021750B7D|nr:MerR family transcriptional regulator [Brachybacterium sp. NBEC-018]UVY84373.1 MerR family transcriptional regulator [Brachybacterium sp. NBEC-018]
MDDERLLTISTFARAVGVPGSALRFYAAEGVLVPAEVDPVTAYRYYAPSQIAAGVLVGRMRAAGVPVPVMREILDAAPPEAVRLVDAIIAGHSSRSRQREQDLAALRESVRPAPPSPPSARAVLPGPVLASAIEQVLPATSRAADDVAGVVWDLREGHLELLATDRYQLASRTLHPAVAEGTARAMTTAAVAAAAAATVARHAEVEVRVDGRRLRLLDPLHDVVLVEAAAVERDVPDLSLLVSTQPPLRAVAGFAAAELVTQLRARAAEQDRAEGPGHVDLHVGATGAEILVDDGPVLQGWASPLREEDGPLRLRLQAALLAPAVSICQGAVVLLGVVDASTPVRVHTPVQDAMTCLVMPMRA